ncbi:MAG: outer membrane beta-barrel protein [Alphaproteobacteria bacterium]|nr:outer membrane beta-barrel protein [Alphaproteobacteria bacterium]
MSKLTCLLAAPALLATFISPATAQDAQQAASEGQADQQGVISYTPADFASAAPNTALDMINRLPGFTLETGDQVRGFAGAAGNVLIDGQRPTIKTDDLSSVLSRIPIGQVERIDVIRGGAAGIDMQGRTVIANVIRKKVDSFQQVFSLNDTVYAETGHSIPGGSYQVIQQSGDRHFDLQLSRGTSYDDSVGPASRTTLNVKSGDVLFQNADTEADGFVNSLRANYNSPLAGGTFSANVLISTDEFKDEEHFYNDTTNEKYVSRSANDRGEVGINYKRPFATKWEVEVLGLSKLAKGTGDATGDDGSSSLLSEVTAQAGESIGRGILRYAPTSKLSFEGGGEAAFNYREQSIGLTLNDQPVVLPASDVRVEEARGEGFLQGTWRPSPKYSFEAGVRVERSKITESGDTPLERSFVYPKPRFVATWSPTKTDQIRLRVEREVGQLNFQDFISAVDLSTSVLSAGNSELRPDKTWAYEVAYEKHFWGNGAAVLTLRHEEITDVVDGYPFLVYVDANHDGVPDDANNDGQPDQQLVSGPGNIGDGTNDVLDFNLTLPMSKLGIQGGELKVQSMFQNSEVRDPLTGEKRRIAGQRPNKNQISYRQDLPARHLTLGLVWFAGWSERYYNLDDVQSLDLRNYWATYLEYKPTPQFSLRADIKNFNPYSFSIRRDIFDGPRGSSDLQTIQIQRRYSQVMGMLTARWTIG